MIIAEGGCFMERGSGKDMLVMQSNMLKVQQSWGRAEP